MMKKHQKNFFKKIKRKFTCQNEHEYTRDAQKSSGLTLYELHGIAKTWLLENRSNFHNPFYMLLAYLLSLSKQAQQSDPISCHTYEMYLKSHCFTKNFPFEIAFERLPVDCTSEEGKHEMQKPFHEKSIIKFINAFDHAYLSKMVQGVFISLIRFLTNQRGTINLLDFGSGETCGMYGENGRFLFDTAGVNIGAIHFACIDDLHKPSGSIFERSTYKKCNILSFHPQEKFDLITGHHVLEHCYNWEDVIVHVSNLLKKNGYLYASFPRFGGFYDTAYRSFSPHDHRANFDIDMLQSFSERSGLELCFSDIYVDPNNRFNWICNLYPDLVNKETADCFYDLCVHIDSKLLLGYHHYGHYVVFRKTA